MLPDELRKLGYDVSEIGEGERIVPTAIVEKFVTGADGTFVALTEGLTRPVASTVTHAGHLQGEALRLRHALTRARAECPLLGG
ncbi:hypothetical protein [Bradyrhizobium sp. URHD0069]|uniref:hypothetical protein n=1 Tax=Bradyrhizobium sp. URHD0069 TaxID=1380355 RepID=UPI0018CC36EC|nr:hypothetical protein [Bradyrhizobium sp. URHD0069]